MALKVLSECWRCVCWNIELPRKGAECDSPVFNLAGTDWQIRLLSYWDPLEKCYAWNVYVREITDSGCTTFLFYIENGSGVIRHVHSEERTSWSSGFVFMFHLYRTMLYETKVDKISIFFQLDLDRSFAKNILEEESFKNKEKIREALSALPCILSLSEDMGKLFDNKEHSDALIKCGDRSFSVSKKILGARSDVFAAMFGGEMSESRTGCVDICDVDSSILELFLRYVYSGRLEGLCKDTALELYGAGDKYAVPSLKRKCAAFLIENLSEENLCEILTLADAFGDAELMDGATSFAVSNPKFLGSERWAEYVESNSAAAAKVFLRCTKTFSIFRT